MARRKPSSPACPYCGARDSEVLTTDDHPLYPHTRRRRECQSCRRRFTTDEHFAPLEEGQHHVHKPDPDEPIE